MIFFPVFFRGAPSLVDLNKFDFISELDRYSGRLGQAGLFLYLV